MNTLFYWYQLFVVIVCFQLLFFFVISCYCYVDKVVLDWWVNLLDGEIASFNLTYKGPNISHWLTGPKPHIHQTPLSPKIISFFFFKSCYLLFSRLFIFVEITTNNNAKQHNNNVEQQIPTDNTHKSQDSKINIQVVTHSLRSIIT